MADETSWRPWVIVSAFLLSLVIFYFAFRLYKSSTWRSHHETFEVRRSTQSEHSVQQHSAARSSKVNSKRSSLSKHTSVLTNDSKRTIKDKLAHDVHGEDERDIVILGNTSASGAYRDHSGGSSFDKAPKKYTREQYIQVPGVKLNKSTHKFMAHDAILENSESDSTLQSHEERLHMIMNLEKMYKLRHTASGVTSDNTSFMSSEDEMYVMQDTRSSECTNYSEFSEDTMYSRYP